MKKSPEDRPEFGVCCGNGVVSLPHLTEPPPELAALLLGQDATSRAFRKDIRRYNSALAMTSVGVTQDRSVIDNGGGPYVYRIQGALHHRIGSLLPPDGVEPSYAQFYLYDPAEALEMRVGRNPDLLREVLQPLQGMLYRHHPFVGVYKQAMEIMATSPVEDCTVRLHVDPRTDGRRYNLPTVDEIAVLLPGDGSVPTDHRDIILRKRGGGLQRICEGHPSYHALHYVLMFPHGEYQPYLLPTSLNADVPTTGESGWHNNMPANRDPESSRKRVTMKQFFAFRLFPREGEADTIFRMGKLFQQYVVDAWAATEQDRLFWYKTNQSTVRAELYQGLRDATIAGDHDLADVGRRSILPSSFTGGSRYMRKLYQDSMAIVREKGAPDYFITMTANPKWPEVAAAMPEGSDEKSRADIVARVFNLKVKHLLELLTVEKIFGATVAHVYTVEFQKRGLPHIHLLLFMARPAKPRTPEHVDSMISAELPDKDEDPELYALVSDFFEYYSLCILLT